MWKWSRGGKKSDEAPVAYPGGAVDAERARQPVLPEAPYKPYSEKPDETYEPYAKKPGPEVPYEPYKDM
jgi:hypothetical protein